MKTLVIEHVNVSELPPRWAQYLKSQHGQTVTVHIEVDDEPAANCVTSVFVTNDPAFGIWRDRES